MKVHWLLPSYRTLCGRPIRGHRECGSVTSRALRATRIEPAVTCRACLRRLAAMGEGAQP